MGRREVRALHGCLAVAVATLAAVARADDGPSFGGRPASAWEEQLRSPDWHARWFAVRAIGRLGTGFDRGTADLVEALGDSDPEVGELAAELLASRGAAAAPAVARLVELIEKRPAESHRFVRWLGIVGAAAPDATIAALSPIFRAEKGGGAAEGAIVAIAANAAEPAVAFLVKCLADADWHVRWCAAFALRSIGAPAKTAVPALIRALDTDKELMAAREAASALGRIGDASEPVLAALARGLSHESNGIRNDCADALVALGEPGFPALRKALDGRFPDARARILLLLPSFPQHGAEVLPAYLAALSNSSPEVRYNAITSLTEFDGVADKALPALRESMKEPSPALRAPAAAAVLRFAPDDPAATTVLLAIARVQDQNVSSCAGWAVKFLVSRHRAAALPFVRTALADPDARVRTAIAGILDYASFGDPAIVPSLLPLLAEPDAATREVALLVLARCGDLDAGAVARVRPLLADPHSKVRAAAARALGGGGPAAHAAVDDCRGLLKSPETGVRVAAALALARLAPGDRAALLPTLAEGLRNDPTTELAEAVCALGCTDPATAETLLDALDKAHTPDTRRACRTALESVLPAR